MSQKDTIRQYLVVNYKHIQEAREKNGFSWKPYVQELIKLHPGIGLNPNLESDRDKLRGPFRTFRKSGIVNSIITPSTPPTPAPKQLRRLIFDIETSPNIVFSWNIGSRVFLSMDNIIQERSIICISWKWEDEDKVYSLSWNKGDDKEMLEKFAEVMNSADIVVTHNGDNFDIRWIRARCMYHGIKISPKFNSIDTLKLARAQFRLNSNKLNYIAQFLGLGSKIETNYNLWKDICLSHDKDALDKMVKYCENDVILLEKVYKALREYSPVKRFRTTI